MASRAGEEVTHTYSRENERNDYSLVNYFFTQVSVHASHWLSFQMAWLPCWCTRIVLHVHAKLDSVYIRNRVSASLVLQVCLIFRSRVH